MSNDTFAALAQVRRPVRAVELPGGTTVHVRDLTLGELRRIDARADEAPDGTERNIRAALLTCGYALCDADGQPACTGLGESDLQTLEDALTTSQIMAVCEAASPSKDHAKN